jgi:2',3'-cyclic-nucleotide 2'-phosphodiesterase (5'-nucleotidase family)
MKRILWIVFLVLSGAAPSRAEAERAIKLTIFHTNDIHGWIMPQRARGEKPQRLVGGAAAFKALVNGEKGPKLVLDAGDWFQGTPEGDITKGQSLVDVLNAVGYDVVEIGNHDFDFGWPRLKQLIAGLKMPVLGANVYIASSTARPPELKSWIIKDVGGVKVGLFGLLTSHMNALTFPANIAGLEFRREVDEAKDAVRALKEQGASVIIAVTHVGWEAPERVAFEGDQTLAREVPGIDVIVGGHSHTFLREPRHEPASGTLIVQTGWELSAAGVVALEIDPKTKRVLNSSGKLVDLYVDQVGSDPMVASVVREQTKIIGTEFDEVIATAAVELSRNSADEAPLGDWITDCERNWAKIDVALQGGAPRGTGGGQIRADLPEGPVTLRELFAISPFENSLVVLTMDGVSLGHVLDYGVSAGKAMVQVSGVSFRYNRSAESGHRLGDVSIAGRPLDPKVFYKVGANDFMVSGGDGYRAFAEAKKAEPTHMRLRDILKECARRQGVVRSPEPGRMREDLP